MKYGVWQLSQVWFKLFVLFEFLFLCFLELYMILHWKLTTYTVYFSVFALCGLSGCSGFHTSLPFCTTMWAHECSSFHRHLFIDGFSLGKLFQVLISFSSFLSYCIEFLSFQPMVFSKKKKKKEETWSPLILVLLY